MYKLLTLISILLLTQCVTQNQNKITTYPVPEGMTTSEDLSVTVNGEPVWVEEYHSNLDLAAQPDWFTGTAYVVDAQIVNMVNFSGSGPFHVSITGKDSIESFVIRPKSKNIKTTQTNKELTFDLTGPENLYIEINNYPVLCFFANPQEENVPSSADSSVLYFGPGVHEAGEIILKDNQTVYIAGGAVVYGCFRGGPANAKITGRGILDGQSKYRLLYLEKAKNLTVEGIIFRNGYSWQNTLVQCDSVVYTNVKNISFGPGGDGIDPLGSQNVTIRNCFFRCTDDCIAIKSPGDDYVVDNVHILNNTFIGFAYSDGTTIGFETNGPVVKNVLVENCDILMARGGSRVDGHSAFSIICDGPAWITDIHFKNIRVEENVEKLFELNITDGTKYGINPPGHIKGVHLEKIQWEIAKPILLGGFDAEHLVEDVTFEGCTIAGQALTQVDSLFKINAFVKDVKFK